MNLQQIIDQLELKPLTKTQDFSQVEPTTGYVADLLSCVMAGAKSHCIWVTLQAHMNIIAVAALLDMGAIIITEGAQPDEATIAKADAQSIPVLSSNRTSFEIVGELWSLGLRGV